jgi:hypothetical protein
MVKPPPVNVLLARPDTTGWRADDIARWQHEESDWRNLNPGHPDFYPLTVKAGYVIGVIHDICESVTCLLKSPSFARRTSYIPAYGLFASAIDLLGRCVEGNSNARRGSIRCGFIWLADPSPCPAIDVTTHTLVTTSGRQQGYSIAELEALRHFALHGQATSQFACIDYEIVSALLPLLVRGLEHYWGKLQGKGEDRETGTELCNRLAKANVLPLRDWPVFNCWSLFERDHTGQYPSVTDVFSKFKDDWRV